MIVLKIIGYGFLFLIIVAMGIGDGSRPVLVQMFVIFLGLFVLGAGQVFLKIGSTLTNFLNRR